jgi:hypothetical protein
VGVTVVASAVDGVRIQLDGVLDEGFDYASLTRAARGTTVLDLEGIRRVTSFGVARWRIALGESRAGSLFFIRCPPCMMTQFNIIRQFDCGGTVVSLFLPYLCPHCGAEHRVLYDRRGAPRFSPSAVSECITCPRCADQAEFDDVPEVYFEYLVNAAPLAADRLLDWLIHAPASSNG